MCKCAQHTYMDRQQIIGGRNLMCNILHLQQRSSTQMVMLEGQSEHGVPDMYGRSPSMFAPAIQPPCIRTIVHSYGFLQCAGHT